ncbi:MAG: glycosyltransferase family 2 protein [Rhodospirillaceae bacterium]|jgi:succinoglycan biosynthesis protein ExoO|nr:glycosyltransferase family 2 protein [Rhodospirillaceae bacterium]MBT4687537.1 glycosyltransferase family 2 protein [Rhodospirillaceae bacterium]MBT5080239.1 glycosyltransferase family 2 protein [Rhodospirillaceae bacterium]MBT5527062.1 glycosyltransferase family 2 protein [Rhodospirillaceae bacterium]MBT5881958.1 glycosyltransferase family 2 protein [Rhodospirillaceae bacterium]
MPLVSILMAAFQAEATITAAVNSVMRQKHPHWELIIASDCGADYIDLCRASGIQDKRIRMVKSPTIGAGPSVARNAAFDQARGDFLAILDSDDTWKADKLSALLPLAMKSGLACDNTCAVNPDGSVIATAYPIDNTQRDIDALAMINSGVPHFPLLRREIAGNGFQAELRFAEDVVFNMEAISRAGAMTLLPRPLTNYIQRPNSATNNATAWRRAEAAYGQILAMLEAGELAVPSGVNAAIWTAFKDKRRLNLAYGAAVESGTATTFQDFLSQQRK